MDWSYRVGSGYRRGLPPTPPTEVWPSVGPYGSGDMDDVLGRPSASTGLSRFVGLLVMDHCPVSGVHALSHHVSLRRVGTLEPQPWETVVSTVLRRPSLATSMWGRADYRAAHPCGVLQIELPPVTNIAQAHTLLRYAGPHWVFALVLRFGATFEPFADLVVDRATNRVDVQYFTGFAHAYFFGMNTTSDYVRRIMPGLLRDPRMRLFVGLLRDFLREPEDSPALLKGWTLLEVMASDEKGGRKEEKVRSLCRTLNVSSDGVLLTNLYAPGDDLLAAVYRHRNCVAHEGWCHPGNERCNQSYLQSPCRQARALRVDLQLFLFGLVADYLGAGTEACVGPDGVRLVDTPGLFQPGDARWQTQHTGEL